MYVLTGKCVHANSTAKVFGPALTHSKNDDSCTLYSDAKYNK